MSVLEIEIKVPDTPEELFELIGDPAEGPQLPFQLELIIAAHRRLIRADLPELRARAPIGLYRLPRAGETVESAWPARFWGPLRLYRDADWALWSSKEKLLYEGGCRVPATALWRGDMMEVSVTLRGTT